MAQTTAIVSSSSSRLTGDTASTVAEGVGGGVGGGRGGRGRSPTPSIDAGRNNPPLFGAGDSRLKYVVTEENVQTLNVQTLQPGVIILPFS